MSDLLAWGHTSTSRLEPTRAPTMQAVVRKLRGQPDHLLSLPHNLAAGYQASLRSSAAMLPGFTRVNILHT
jgi:hypothetical protein